MIAEADAPYQYAAARLPGLAGDALQARQAGGGVLVGGVGLGDHAQALVGAGQLQGGLRRARVLLLQRLQHRPRLGVAAQLHQGPRQAVGQVGVLGVHALGGGAVEALGLVPFAELAGGGGQTHAVVDRGAVVHRLSGGAVVAGGIEGLARLLAGLARGGPLDDRGHQDGQEIDQPADRLEHQDDHQPVHLAARAHHVDAEQDREQERQAKEWQRQAHLGFPNPPHRLLTKRGGPSSRPAPGA